MTQRATATTAHDALELAHRAGTDTTVLEAAYDAAKAAYRTAKDAAKDSYRAQDDAARAVLTSAIDAARVTYMAAVKAAFTALAPATTIPPGLLGGPDLGHRSGHDNGRHNARHGAGHGANGAWHSLMH